MFSYFGFILIAFQYYLLLKCPLVQTRKLLHPEICVDNQIQTYSISHLKLCYSNYIEYQLTFVWFSIDKSLNDTFDYYRFTFRPHESSHSSRTTIEILTNFTQLIDTNNSLRILNLHMGEYEVCVEFRSDTPLFIYQPRDGCITISVGRSIGQTFSHDSTALLIALAIGIAIFFILGLVVQWGKERRKKRAIDDKNQIRSLSSRISTKSLKQQRDRLIRNLFQQHLEQSPSSQIRQWARDQAFRHRISVHEQDFEQPNFIQKWNKSILGSIQQSRSVKSSGRIPTSQSILTTNELATVSEEQDNIKSPEKVSFHLSTTDEFNRF